MSLTTQNARLEYTAEAGQTTFVYDFRIFAATDLAVYKNASLLTTSQYSVTGVGEDAGGSVVLVTEAEDGDEVIIESQIPATQDVTYTPGGAFPAASHERGLDRLTRLVQQLRHGLSRCLQVNTARSFGLSDLELPVPSGAPSQEDGRWTPVWNDERSNLELAEFTTETGLLASTVESATLAGLPAAGTAGRLRQLLDSVRGMVLDLGPRWLHLFFGRANAMSWCVGDGVSDDYANLTAMLASVAAQPSATLHFPGPFLYRIGSNLTFPATVHLRFDHGAVLQPDAGVTLTIAGHIAAGPYQIFHADDDTTGVVDMTSEQSTPLLAEYWGAVGDGATDDTAACQQALNQGHNVHFPSTLGYAVTTLSAQNNGMVLTGPGRWKAQGLIGDGSGVTLTLGDGDGSPRRFRVHGLRIAGGGAVAVFVHGAPDFEMINSQVTTSGAHALSMVESYRNTVKDCTITTSGAFHAVHAVDNCNGLLIEGCTISGGSAGTAIVVEQSQAVTIRNNIIESSYDAIWVASTSDTGFGNCNGLTLEGNYIEASRTPFALGLVSAVQGCRITGNYVGNASIAVISDRLAVVSLYRLSGAEIRGNTWNVHSTEYLYDLYEKAALSSATSSLLGLAIYNNITIGTPAGVWRGQGTFGGNASVLRERGARRYFDFCNGDQSRGSLALAEYVSPTITCNVGLGAMVWLPNAVLEFGGKVYSAEIIEATGALDGTLELGRAGDPDELVDVALSTLSPTNGYAALTLLTSTATLRADEGNRIQHTAGAATTSFRVRIRYRAN